MVKRSPGLRRHSQLIKIVKLLGDGRGEHIEVVSGEPRDRDFDSR